MFDNQVDPWQTNNLVNVPQHQALQADLEAVLARKLKERGDAFRPGSEYLEKWGYTVDKNGTVPYGP
jgi:hypothetical protein